MTTSMAKPYPHGTAAFAPPSYKKQVLGARERNKTARGLGSSGLDASSALIGMKWRFLRNTDAADVARLADFVHDYAPSSASTGGGGTGGGSGSTGAVDGEVDDAAELLQALQEQQARIAANTRHNATHARATRQHERASASRAAASTAPPKSVSFAATRRPLKIEDDDDDDEDDDKSNDGASDDDHSGAPKRSASPVILWRTSARVKVADDIPSELKSAFVAAGASAGHAAARASASALASSGAAPATATGTDAGASASAAKRAPPREGSKRAFALQAQRQQQKTAQMCERRKQYGAAWFMPAEVWHVTLDADAEDDESLNSSAQAGTGAFATGAAAAIRQSRAAAAEMERRLDETRAQLGALEISRAYKQFILEQKNTANTWTPHYLKNVSLHDAPAPSNAASAAAASSAHSAAKK